MITLHTVYVVSLVSQVTSAVVLAILAWVDRRSRWLVPLAAACALHAAAIYLMPLWRGTGLWFPQALSAVVLIAMFYLIQLGLQSLVAPHRRYPARAQAALLALMLVVFALAPFQKLWATEIAWMAAIVLQAWVIHTLWTGRLRELRVPLRATALLFLAILVLFLIRLPLEFLVPAPPLLLPLRKITMLLLTFMAFSFLALYAAESRRRLHEESRLDALTGLPNRRAMEEEAARRTQLATRRGTPCALLMLDLDDFKKLNDTWGHGVGDRALQAAGALLLSTAEEVGQCSVARMGGEEFAIMLSDWSVTAAHQLGEQLRTELAALRIRTQRGEIGFTASIGVSSLQTGETTWAEMLQRADVALYGAKRAGRNRVVLCTEATLRGVPDETGGWRNAGIRRRDQLPHSAPPPQEATNELSEELGGSAGSGNAGRSRR